MSKYGSTERKYYVECRGNPNHAGNQWRYHDEDRPDRCATCGGPVEATLIEADGERMVIDDTEELAAEEAEAHVIDLEREGDEISEQVEREAEERYAGPEESEN